MGLRSKDAALKENANARAKGLPIGRTRLAVLALACSLLLNVPLVQAEGITGTVPFDAMGEGVVPGVIGHVGEVRIDDEDGMLHVALELDGFMDAAVPGPMGNPFVYEVTFTTDHNGLEQEYALQYTYETDPFHADVIADKFSLAIKTEANAGLQSICPVDADLSDSHYDFDNFEPVWVVALSEFDHDARTPQGDCSMAAQRDGRGLEAGDVLREIVGSATAKVAVIQFSDLRDTTEAPDYTIQGAGEPDMALDSVSPDNGTAEGGTSVVLTGSGFDPEATVWFDGTVAESVVWVDAGELTAVTPAHPEGTVDVRVMNPDGSSATRTDGFTFVAEAEPEEPSIRIDSPSDGEQVAPDFNATGTFFAGNGEEPDRAATGTNQRAPLPEGDLEHLRVPVPEGATWNLAQDYNPLLPGLWWNDAIGPGTPLAIAFTPGASFPEFICTANWVFNDHTGAVYLGAAGHCFLPGDTRTTHGDSGDVPVYDPEHVTVWACAGDCIAGGQTGSLTDIFLGNYIEIGAVEYARQKPADGRLGVDGDGIGYDFGIVRIPDEMLHMVDTSMPVWGGPDETFTGDSFLMPMALHGSGMVYGETFATKSRLGESLGSLDGRSWTALIPAFGGDSGSSVSVYTDFMPVGTPAAHGLLTHGIIGAPYSTGTLMGQALELAFVDAGLCIQPIMAGQAPGEAEPAPGCEEDDDNGGGGPGSSQTFVQVRLGNGSWVTVDVQANGTWEHAFRDVAPGDHELHARLVDEQGLSLADDTISFTVGDCPGSQGQGQGQGHSGQGCPARGQGGPNCPQGGQGSPQCREEQQD